MENWIDFYQVLGVDPDSDQKNIKRVYRNKVQILHPDRLSEFSEGARQQAEEDLKRLNQAYDALKDPDKRARYHTEWMQRNADIKTTYFPKPKPLVNPASILVKNLKPGEFKVVSFTVENLGGPYKRIWISNPDSWAKLVGWSSVGTDELPLKVEFDIGGTEWGKTYSERIVVKLDEEEAVFTIKLQMKGEPITTVPSSYSQPYVPPSPPSSPPPPPPSPQIPSVPAPKVHSPLSMGTKLFLGAIFILVLILASRLYRAYQQSYSPSPLNTDRRSTGTIISQTNPNPLRNTIPRTDSQIKELPSVPKYTLLKKAPIKKGVDPQVEESLATWVMDNLRYDLAWTKLGYIGEGYKIVHHFLYIWDYIAIETDQKYIWVMGTYGFKGYLFHSSDGGKLWDVQWEKEQCTPIVVFFLNESEGWLGTDKGLFYTQDMGWNWQFRNGPQLQHPEKHFSFEGKKKHYWFYSNYRIVVELDELFDSQKYESLDGGKTWRVLENFSQE